MTLVDPEELRLHPLIAQVHHTPSPILDLLRTCEWPYLLGLSLKKELNVHSQ